MVEVKRGQMTEGIERHNGQTIKSLEENQGYKFLGILKHNNVKSTGMKEIARNELFQENDGQIVLEEGYGRNWELQARIR